MTDYVYIFGFSDTVNDEQNPTQELQNCFELTLKERDAALRDNARILEERNQLAQQLEALRSDRDQALANTTHIKPNNR